MKITSYEVQKHNKEKLNVYLDGEYAFPISINGWTKNLLYIGKCLEQEDIDTILANDVDELLFDRILTILSYGMKTENEVVKKLKEKGFEDEPIERAIEKAIKYGYINDEYYVKCYIKDRALPNKWGKTKITTNLIKKGVSKDIINDSLDKYLQEDDMLENAYQLGLKKYNIVNKNNIEKRKCMQKISTFLMGRGYSYDIVKVAIDRIFGDSEE